MAATLTRTPLVLTEADSHLGLANRMLAGRARRVCLAFPIEGRSGDRYLVTGRPVPDAVLAADRGAARERFGIGAGERVVLVVGGSHKRGRSTSPRSRRSPSGPGGLPRAPSVGGAGPRRVPDRLEAAPYTEGYELIEYEPNLGDVLAACDLVLGRSGGSIFEFTAAGRPAVLVPYPYATADHQRANARWMAGGGCGGDRRRRRPRPDGAARRGRRDLRRRGAAGADGERGARDREAAGGADDRRPGPRGGGPMSGPVPYMERGSGASDERLGGRRLHFIGIGGAGMSGSRSSARGSARRSAAATAASPLIWSGCGRRGSSR